MEHPTAVPTASELVTMLLRLADDLERTGWNWSPYGANENTGITIHQIMGRVKAPVHVYNTADARASIEHRHLHDARPGMACPLLEPAHQQLLINDDGSAAIGASLYLERYCVVVRESPNWGPEWLRRLADQLTAEHGVRPEQDIALAIGDLEKDMWAGNL